MNDIEKNIEARLANAPVVPLIQADDPKVAIATTNALIAGGLSVIEVVMRTDAALDCMAAIKSECDGAIVGAGTVLTPAHADKAIDMGAEFIVSPGLVEDTVNACLERDIPSYAGVATAGEAQRAYAMGLRTVKFFPASLAGGVPMLKALSSVFREMRFMPTGGVSASNLADFLAVRAIIACGGSWLTPAKAIEAGDYDTVTALAKEAVEIAKAARPSG